MLNQKIELLNQNLIPTIGFGTWLIENENAAQAVKVAIESGYRHIDTAQNYQNEEGVGLGIIESGLKREELFVTTKIRARYKTYEEAKASIVESLAKLKVDYIDLMLIHWPQPWDEKGSANRYEKENLAVWKAMEEAYADGKIKALGVSNFTIEDIKNIQENASIKPMVNQIEVHVGQTPVELINFCHENGIIVEAYSPIGHGNLLNNEDLKIMAEKYKVSVAQICIRYTIQLGCVTLPKSSQRKHIEANAKVNFEISDKDMELLKQVEIKSD